MLTASMREKNWLFISSIHGENQEQNWVLKKKELKRFRSSQKRQTQHTKRRCANEVDGMKATAVKNTK
jgi:hypothetical protein